MTWNAHAYVGTIQAWPPSLEVPVVVRHKSMLIQQGDLLAAIAEDSNLADLARAVYRGAAVWEHWLLERVADSEDDAEARAVSALDLARQAGDWGIVSDVLATWARLGRPTHKRFFRERRALHDRQVVAANRARAELGKLFDRFGYTHAPQDADSLRARALRTLHETGLPVDVLFVLARTEVLLGQLNAAERDLAALCIADPFYPSAVGFLADVRSRRSRHEACEVLRSAEVCQGQDAVYLAYRSRFEWELWKESNQQTPPPVEIARRALAAARRKPDYPAAAMALARLVASFIFEADGKRSEAIGVLREGIAERPSDGNLLVQLGVLLLDAGQDAEGRDALVRGSVLLPDVALVEGLIGAHVLAQGEAREAVSHFEKAVRIAATSFERGALLNDLGVALARAGRRADAMHAFDEAAVQLPDDDRPRRNRELLASGDAAGLKASDIGEYRRRVTDRAGRDLVLLPAAA